jgi:hypothetical protein
MSDRDQAVPDPSRLYSDGWPVRADDVLAETLFTAMTGGAEAGYSFGELQEWQRDEYRAAASAAREFIATEARFRGAS